MSTTYGRPFFQLWLLLPFEENQFHNQRCHSLNGILLACATTTKTTLVPEYSEHRDIDEQQELRPQELQMLPGKPNPTTRPNDTRLVQTYKHTRTHK